MSDDLHNVDKCDWSASPLQVPEELQRLVNLVKEEPLPADAPPLPEESQAEDMAGETDGGEGLHWADTK